MQRVRGRRCDHDFGVTGNLDLPALSRAVGDANPAQFDIVLGRYDDFGMGLDVCLVSPGTHGIVAPELGAPLGENRLIILRSLERRLMGGRPKRAA